MASSDKQSVCCLTLVANGDVGFIGRCIGNSPQELRCHWPPFAAQSNSLQSRAHNEQGKYGARAMKCNPAYIHRLGYLRSIDVTLLYELWGEL